MDYKMKVEGTDMKVQMGGQETGRSITMKEIAMPDGSVTIHFESKAFSDFEVSGILGYYQKVVERFMLNASEKM